MKEKNSFFKKAMLALCLMAVCWLPARADVLPGDVNNDGRTSIDDVVELIDYLLSGDAASIDLANADVDQDGRVNINDVTDLIDLLLNQSQNPEPVEGDWVDLGLPSGTIWATRNVGANSPEDYGAYFAWGETAPKDYYGENNYKWCQEGYYDENGHWHNGGLTKYCPSPNCVGIDGFTDDKTELDPEDDAAYVNWGPQWRMPTWEQQQELIDNCTWTWTTRNGVNGRLGTGPNGNTIFLPAAGTRYYEPQHEAGINVYFYSRSFWLCDPDYYLVGLYFDSWRMEIADCALRTIGCTVRAVRVSQN